MKKALYLLITLTLMCACASPEKKADRLIRDYMFAHLHDFDSYQKVETSVDTLYNLPIFNDECIDQAEQIIARNRIIEITERDAKHNSDIMNIWSDSYTQSGFKRYKEAYVDWARNKKTIALAEIIKLENYKKLAALALALDGCTQTGWIVTHSYRSKTLGGNTSLNTMVFFTDKDFKEITKAYDEENTPDFDAIGDAILTSVSFTTDGTDQVDSLINQWKGIVEKYDQTIQKYE